MKISLILGDDGACGLYRLAEPAKAVQAVRPDWTVTTYDTKSRLTLGTDAAGRIVDIMGLDPWPDVLVVQRVGDPEMVELMIHLQSRGVAIVTDFDDAMWCIDRGNTAWKAWNGNGFHWRWSDLAGIHADLITVTTPGLATRYGKHGRVEILPNRIPDRWVVDQPLPTDCYAGWAGFTSTHPGDCEVAAKAARVFAENGGLRVVGDARGASKAWGVEVESIAKQNLGPNYFSAINQIGVMLVGLRDTSFNRAKSTLKVLEAAAAGIPAIAAATAPHRALAREFPLRVASSPAEWEKHAKDLCDRDVRLEAAEQARKAIDRFTISAQAEAWALAWERAANRRAKM